MTRRIPRARIKPGLAIRKIRLSQILVFMVLLACAGTGAVLTAVVFDRLVTLGDFRGVVLVAVAIFALYLYAILIFRLFLRAFPLRAGEIAEGSQQEFVYHVYVLFFLMLFYSIMRSGFMPAPLMRLFYLAIGARLGANTYTQGIIHDPRFVEIGDNSVVGQYALLIPHVIEGRRLAHYPIRIGHNVTIGAGATVLAGVVVGDGAIVSTGAVVTKETLIGDGEIWGGIPARLLGRTSGLLPSRESPPLT